MSLVRSLAPSLARPLGTWVGTWVASVALTLLCAAPADAGLSTREFSELKRQVTGALRAGDARAALEAVRALAQDDSKRAADFLCELGKVPDSAIYEAACEAVAGMRAAEVEDLILSRLGRSGGHALEKMVLVDAMAKRLERSKGDAFAGKALGAALGARQEEVQRAALAGIKRHEPQQAMDGLIGLLASLERSDPDGLNATLVRDALHAITKESFETAEDWGKFWEPRRGRFRPTTGGAQRSDQTARRERPRFFGSEIKSNRLVFVIDTSGSMEAADGSTGDGESRVRIERAKRQLTQVIEQLPDGARFTILAYSGVINQSMQGISLAPEWLGVWSPKLQSASSSTKDSAKSFVNALKPNGGTFTLNALKIALEVDGADTIVLLSDGMPNDVDLASGQPLTQQQILEEVATLNRAKRRVIDTFGFDPAGEAAGALPGGFRRGTGGARPAGWPGGMGGGSGLGQFMQDLAGQNGGDYTQIK